MRQPRPSRDRGDAFRSSIGYPPMRARPVSGSRRPAEVPSRSSARHPARSALPLSTVRGVMKRFFGWITRNRSLYQDVEARTAFAATFLYTAANVTLVRRLELADLKPLKFRQGEDPGMLQVFLLVKLR